MWYTLIKQTGGSRHPSRAAAQEGKPPGCKASVLRKEEGITVKTMKRCLLLALAALLLLTLAAPALAVEAEPTALVRHCTECGTGTVTTRVERTYIYSEYRECEHYPSGNDVYDVYLVEYTESCDSCSYSANWINQSEEYGYCAGFN